MIGQKAGMTRIFDSTGISVPVTAISVTPNQITQIKTLETDGYKAVQVSYGQKKESKVKKLFVLHLMLVERKELERWENFLVLD